MPRQQRIGGRGGPDRHDQERGEHRLGDEQLRHPLNVAQHLAALGDHRRHRGEVAADQHDVGDAAGHLHAAALRDREPRGLQRRHVVDAVADHRHVAPAVAQRLDDARLSSGEMRPITDAGRRPPRRARAGSAGSSRPSSAAPGGRPTSAAIAATVAGASPERTITSTPSSCRKATVSRASAAQPLGEDRHARAREAGGPRRACQPASGPSACARATTRRPAPPRRPRARAAPRRAASDSGAPSTQAPSPSSTALQRRREENGTARAPASGLAGKAAAIAASVRLGAGAAAA